MDCIHPALLKVFQEPHTWRTQALGIKFQRGQMWLVGFPHVLAFVCAQCMMEVWEAEWNEGLWCQKLTSCGFSCPAHRRHLKFDAGLQISHVAYICTEIPPRSIGCFEMDVNMNLLAIHPSPLGCLYSARALLGQRRVLKQPRAQLSRAVYPIMAFVWKWVKHKKFKKDFTIILNLLTLPN